MSKQQPDPEFNQLREPETRELSHSEEEKSITGSAQSIGLEPSENFVAPTMAAEAFDPESD